MQWAADPEAPGLAANARLLYEACLLDSGFLLEDVLGHNARLLELLAQDMGVADLGAVLEEEEYPELPEAEAPKEGAPAGVDFDDPELQALMEKASLTRAETRGGDEDEGGAGAKDEL